MNISILGCGWLGLPLAKRLIQQEHVVKGSTTGREKILSLQQEGIIPYQIKILAEGVQGDLTAFLSETELAIIDIPLGLRSDPEANFVGRVERLKVYLEKSPVKYVLFVSATSIYEDSEKFPVYTENDLPNGVAENSRQLLASEKILNSSPQFSNTVLRFGGLIGPGRHPVKYLAGRSGLKDPGAPVNLIHLEDCLGIIETIIEKEAWGNIFNAVYPEHPFKGDYYTRIAKEKELALPKFDPTVPSKGKIIKSVKVEDELGYKFSRGIY